MKRICKKCNHKCHCKGQGYYVSDSSCEDIVNVKIVVTTKKIC